MESHGNDMFAGFQELFFTFQTDAIMEEARRLIDSGAPPNEFLTVCQQCMNMVGKRFEEGEYFLPELVVTGDIFKNLGSLLKPHLVNEGTGKSSGCIVVGTPKGDIHSLGKDIFCTLAEAAGFEVHNLGEDVAPEAFINKVNETGARVIGMSSLLTTTYSSMQQVIRLLEERGMRECVKVVIGGGATTKELAQKLGADAQTWDAYEGVRIIQSFLA